MRNASKTLGLVVALAVLLAACWAPTTRKPYATGSDASGLTSVAVARMEAVPTTPAEAETRIVALVKEAAATGVPLSMAGARHSMGGQTAASKGVVLDMTPLNQMELLADGETLRVGAGARWSQIIPYLDEHGRSVAIMQSNNDFTVGGSISVNCHGWQTNRPPIVDSVRAIRLVRASGDVVRCTREENADLFSHAIGGYGTFGAILEVELETVPNRVYHVDSLTMKSANFNAAWTERVEGRPDVPMAYGRLSVNRGDLFKEALLTTFSDAPGIPVPKLWTKHGGFMDGVRRGVFRAGVDNNFGKWFRWQVETGIGESLAKDYISRNNILNEPSAIYAERNPKRTDVLHEYFVPRARMMDFLNAARDPILKSKANLMNVTIRQVLADRDTALPFAREECFAFVMLFNYDKRNAEKYANLTRELIDVALDCGGTYYLPYRLEATPEQFQRAYPMARDFFAAKDREDPKRIFRNQFEEWARRGESN